MSGPVGVVCAGTSDLPVAEEAIVTTASGCVAITGGPHSRDGYAATIEPLATVASVGSGDAFLAGYVSARRAGRPASACLAYGVAAGAESTQHLGAGMLDPLEVERLADRVRVSRLEVAARVA